MIEGMATNIFGWRGVLRNITCGSRFRHVILVRFKRIVRL
jgi:hypothetical protein